MKGRYNIYLLPEGTIAEDEKGMFKIKGDTFPNIPIKLRIRPRAVNFAKNRYPIKSPVYAVVYSDENNIQCLFAFRYIYSEYHEEGIFYMCRCLGSTITKKHWEYVIEHINKHSKQIKQLSGVQSIVFY